MKLSEKKQKEVEAAIKKYIKSLDIKDENGIKTGSNLRNDPQTLQAFYRQPFFLELRSDEERYEVKMMFKAKLPYKEWAKYMSKTPGALRSAVEDFQELVDPKYKRRTERREDKIY